MNKRRKRISYQRGKILDLQIIKDLERLYYIKKGRKRVGS